jgi:hypothetical protein
MWRRLQQKNAKNNINRKSDGGGEEEARGKNSHAIP